MGGDVVLSHRGPCLAVELVWLLGAIQNHEPPAEIAARCREIAAAYQQQPSLSPWQDANRREIVQNLLEEADRFSRRANAPSDPAVGGDGVLTVP